MIRRALVRPLTTLAEELDALGADWAVAGATALALHGFDRATKDVDVFVGDDARQAILDRLAVRGQWVEDVFPPSHYAVRLPRGRDPDVRIDLLFPALGIESLGLMAARRAPIAGRDMPVVPLAHLIAAKLAVDPEEDPDRFGKDQHDLRELWVRGLVDPRAVERVLRDADDLPAIARLRRLVGAPGP